MFEVKRLGDKVFEIRCDGFDERLLNATIAENHKSLIDVCMSVVKAFVKGAKLVLYPDTQG